jgi:RimJ/RimL family protein N-acetyltransferase
MPKATLVTRPWFRAYRQKWLTESVEIDPTAGLAFAFFHTQNRRAMSALVTLSGDRVRLRRWDYGDRDAFAAMNCDARVMEFFRSRLSRPESDAMVDGILKHFSKHGFGLWAIEVPGVAPFVGFAGIAVACFSAHFTPCVEIGWRLAFEHWGRGYATEAARLALGYGFGTLALPEVVSFTTAANNRSRAVMERLGMRHDPSEDFDYPLLPENHPLRRHVLYRLGSGTYFGKS